MKKKIKSNSRPSTALNKSSACMVLKLHMKLHRTHTNTMVLDTVASGLQIQTRQTQRTYHEYENF
jgi:hypothetical protein